MASKGGQQADGQDPVARSRGRQIDELDRKIIKMLQADGRLANTEIARALDVTETTVRKRIAHLLDERLMSIVAVPAPEAAGMTLSAIISISVELTAIHQVADAIRSYREVRYAGMSVLHRPGAPLGVHHGPARQPAGDHRPGDVDHPQGGQVLLRVGDQLAR